VTDDKKKTQVRKPWGPRFDFFFLVLSSHKVKYELDLYASQMEYALPLLAIVCGFYLSKLGLMLLTPLGLAQYRRQIPSFTSK
jgi:hypothetical protein